MIPKYIIVHHTASNRDKTTVADVNAWHKVRNFTLSSLGFYVGYHYLISGDGKTIQTRRAEEVGCHCVAKNHNFDSIGVCLTGNFGLETSTPAQLASLQDLLDRLKLTYKISGDNIKGHREVSATECPGKNLMDWLNAYKQLSTLQILIAKIKELIRLKFL